MQSLMEVLTEIQILLGLWPIRRVGDQLCQAWKRRAPRHPGPGAPCLLLAAGLGCSQEAGRCTVVFILTDAWHYQRLAGNLVFPFSFRWSVRLGIFCGN